MRRKEKVSLAKEIPEVRGLAATTITDQLAKFKGLTAQLRQKYKFYPGRLLDSLTPKSILYFINDAID